VQRKSPRLLVVRCRDPGHRNLVEEGIEQYCHSSVQDIRAHWRKELPQATIFAVAVVERDETGIRGKSLTNVADYIGTLLGKHLLNSVVEDSIRLGIPESAGNLSR